MPRGKSCRTLPRFSFSANASHLQGGCSRTTSLRRRSDRRMTIDLKGSQSTSPAARQPFAFEHSTRPSSPCRQEGSSLASSSEGIIQEKIQKHVVTAQRLQPTFPPASSLLLPACLFFFMSSLRVFRASAVSGMFTLALAIDVTATRRSLSETGDKNVIVY